MNLGTRTPSGTSQAAQMAERACEATRLLKVMANDRRLMILCLLSEREHSVGELNERVELSQSALSQHLAVLREEGLVTTRRDAQTIHYSLVAGPALQVMQTLYGIYCAPLRGASGRKG